MKGEIKVGSRVTYTDICGEIRQGTITRVCAHHWGFFVNGKTYVPAVDIVSLDSAVRGEVAK